MASLVDIDQNVTIISSLRCQNSATFEQHRPIMLKDFLRDDCSQLCSPSSSSSNGFHMYPRKNIPIKSKVQLTSKSSNKPSMVLLRTRSRKAAATTISAVHKLINVVKFLPFVSVKSPSVLRRSSKSEKINVSPEVAVKVKVKDILRWRSFRDMVDEKSTVTTSSCSTRSSWCDSDFTSEDYLPPWCGENEELWGKKSLVGEYDTNHVALKNPKGAYSFEDSEQQSPVSVLESTFRENEGYFSRFLVQRIEESEVLSSSNESAVFEEEEEEEEKVDAIVEKATMLLSRVKELTSTNASENQSNYHQIVMDFFVHELSTNEDLNDDKFDNEILNIGKSWMNGEYDGESYEWELKDKREGYVKDMEKGVEWKKFKQEQEEITKELEIKVLNELLDEVLDDLIF